MTILSNAKMALIQIINSLIEDDEDKCKEIGIAILNINNITRNCNQIKNLV